ncbi:MAG: ATP-binding cassette domain-containing protein [Firmicutes bacterium]|nr:ATP-binding cassette domain-containing protein [Bacillota bacterium]
MENKRPGRRPVMEVRDLSFAYGANRVLKKINLQIPRGRITTIMGANGCGKSTLFSLMTKNLMPASGRIFLNGRNINNLTLREFARQVAIVQQYNKAADDITVQQLVSFGRTPHITFLREDTEEDEKIIEFVLDATGLKELRDREISRLSGGQRQRVWIAMALAQSPKVLFLDEPTTYLDVRYQVEILELVKRLNREFGLTIVMVLHDINQAIHYSDHEVGLLDGKVRFFGKPEDVITSESIYDLYGVNLGVTDVNGRTFVLPVKEVKADDVMKEKEAEMSSQEHSSQWLVDALTAGAEDADAENTGYDFTAGGEVTDSESAGQSPAAPGESGDGYFEEYDEADEEVGTARRKISRLWVIPGILCLVLGSIGIVLPILPTVPFYLAAAFCFAKGSQKLYDWFVNTGVYHKHLEGFVKKKGMTVKTKLSIIGSVTVIMGLGFVMMSRVPVGRIILAAVWLAHIIYFGFVVKTMKEEDIDERFELEEESDD